MQAVCEQCHHATYLHNVWSICGVLGCGPCHTEMPCPRCKHKFSEHMVSDDIVFCSVKACDYLTCYAKARPDRPLMKAIGRGVRPAVKPLPPANEQVTYEDSLYSMLPAIYKNIVQRPAARVIAVTLPDPGVEKGYV